MDRRKFLQNMFGAAVITAMPKIVVDQIISLPEPIPISPAVNGVTPILTKRIIMPPNGLLYIWDDERNILIGASDRFSLDLKQDVINIGFDDLQYPQFIRGQRSWNISASNIQWVNNPEELFEEKRQYKDKR
jgi:hypothetical protein